jgi:hypothetical protein
MKLNIFPDPVHLIQRLSWNQRQKTSIFRWEQLPLNLLARQPESCLPPWVRESALARRYLQLLSPIAWDAFPQRLSDRAWPGPTPDSPVPYVIALLIKLDQKYRSMGQLVALLHQHPELVWLAGFPLIPDRSSTYGFDVGASVPSPIQFSQLLRSWPNERLQFLLGQTVSALRTALPATILFGDMVSLDTKLILAWVRENNPKEYIKDGRFDKKRQPSGDPDCRLGCKRRSNQRKQGEMDVNETPTREGSSVTGLGVGVGEFYWGYASGIAATKVPDWGEFVLAELTQPFDQSDVSYFHPLMEQVEQRLGRKPRFGTADAAYDAWYVYEYFYKAGGFAAVPLVERNPRPHPRFTNEGTPLCQADLPMHLKGAFMNHTSFIAHERQRWVCPLLHPQPNGSDCPVNHDKWPQGGCQLTMASSPGARQRYQIDRESEAYVSFYKQRTACERLFSLAVDLGIERPKLRNQRSITNINTLIYTLLNLRAWQRIQEKQAK